MQFTTPSGARHKSNIVNISCGAPYGSILDPLHVFVYKNYIQNSATDAKLKQFVDDNKLFIFILHASCVTTPVKLDCPCYVENLFVALL